MRQPIWALLPLLLAFTVASGATTTSLKRQLDKNILRSFEKQLLANFGMSTRPKPKKNITISDYMWELYKKQSKFHRGHHGRTDTIRCFRGQEKSSKKGYEPNRARYKFKIDGIPDHEKVWAAELVIYRPAVPANHYKSSKSPIHRVQIFDVLRLGSKKKTESKNPLLRLVDTRTFKSISGQRGVWEAFDVLHVLQRWQAEPSANYGLYIELSSTVANTSASQHVRLKRDIGESRERWLEFQPLLVTYSRDTTQNHSPNASRARRSSPRKHRRKGRKDNCRRHALYVDFSDVGWNDWIVAPPGYDAFFCHGDCPFPLADHLNSTNHAIVQTLVNSVNPAAVPRACCVPTELSPISMLYVDEYDKVVLKNYQDMVVEGCGCR